MCLYMFTKEYLPFIIIILFLLFIIYSFIVITNEKIKSKMKILLIPSGLVVELLVGFLFTGIIVWVTENNFETTTAISNSSVTETSSVSNISTDKISRSINNDSDSYISITETSKEVIITKTTKEEVITTIPRTTEKTETTTVEPTVHLSFERINNMLTDNNADLRAFTSFKADKVTLISTVDGIPVGSFTMKSNDGQNWVMHANFYEENIYVITAIAEGPMGEVKSNTVTVEYPF